MNTVVIKTQDNPGCLLQLLWFALVGWWLGQVWMIAAWALMVTIIGIPLAVWMLDRLPKVIALRGEGRQVAVTTRPDGTLIHQEVDVPQVSLVIRALYFLLVGWWFSALWMEAAYLLCLTVIGLPLGFWMLDRIPAVLTLRQGA